MTKQENKLIVEDLELRKYIKTLINMAVLRFY